MLDKTQDYKIDVTELTVPERIKLQEKLFELGYDWGFTGRTPSHLDSKYIFLGRDSIIGCSNRKKTFKDDSNIILNAYDIIQEPEPIITPQGISLRDYFAGCALSAMAGITESGVSTYDGMTLKSVAKEVYQVADAMLEERNK
jgi:hypothetical protein